MPVNRVRSDPLRTLGMRPRPCLGNHSVQVAGEDAGRPAQVGSHSTLWGMGSCPHSYPAREDLRGSQPRRCPFLVIPSPDSTGNQIRARPCRRVSPWQSYTQSGGHLAWAGQESNNVFDGDRDTGVGFGTSLVFFAGHRRGFSVKVEGPE